MRGGQGRCARDLLGFYVGTRRLGLEDRMGRCPLALLRVSQLANKPFHGVLCAVALRGAARRPEATRAGHETRTNALSTAYTI